MLSGGTITLRLWRLGCPMEWFIIKIVQTHPNATQRKSISSGDIFPKIIWEAQSGQESRVRVRIWGWRPIPGGGVDFWLDPGIWADYSILAWICDISAFCDLNGFSVILAGLKSRPFRRGPRADLATLPDQIIGVPL